MIPRRAILKSAKLICKGIIRSNGALGDAVDSVHLHGSVLSKTMPMNHGAVISQFICDVDSDEITPAGFDPWARVGLIEDLSIRTSYAVAVDGLVINHKPILQTWVSVG
jgi:hypothetical protein